MKRTLCLIIAALAIACGGSKTDSAQSTSGTSPNPAAVGDQTVVMTGCLHGDQANVPVGTSGARPNDQITSSGGTGMARFTLTNATPASSSEQPSAQTPTAGTGAATGVGANGAGGSGGPLVSGISSYALVGNSSDLSPHVNHQVRITGNLSSTTTAYDAADRAPASDQIPGAAGTSGPAMRTITVDKVEMVAANCSQP